MTLLANRGWILVGLLLAGCSSSTSSSASSSGSSSGAGPADPVPPDAAACAAIKPDDGEYTTKSSSAIPSCFQDHKLSDWFDGPGFANRGTGVQFNSDDLCQADTATCSIKSSCGVFVNIDSVGTPAHVDFVGVWQDAKHFTGTISLSVPSLDCSGKVAVTGTALF